MIRGTEGPMRRPLTFGLLLAVSACVLTVSAGVLAAPQAPAPSAAQLAAQLPQETPQQKQARLQ